MSILYRSGVAIVAITLGLGFFGASETVAQEPGAEFVGVLSLITRDDIGKELGLSSDQRTKLVTLANTYEDRAMDVVLSSGDAPSDELQRRLAPIRREAEMKGLPILSDSQRELLQQIVAREMKSTQRPVSSPSSGDGAASVPRASSPASPGTASPDARPIAVDQAPGDQATGNGSSTDDAMPDHEAEEVASEPGKLRFSFQYQPWQDVIEWFAEQADLSLMLEDAPLGTFNYTDPREYTPTDALDLLNGVLLTKGFTLVRRDRMLMVFNLEDGPVPPELVSTISPEDLDQCGKYELVRVLFNLDNMTPDEAEAEIQKLIGPQGSVVPLHLSQQILVTETGGQLRAIRSVIERTEKAGEEVATQFRTFQLEAVIAEDAMAVIRQLFDIPEDSNATPDGSLRIALDLAADRLLVNGSEKQLTKLSEALKIIDVPDPALAGELGIEDQPQLIVYTVTTADPESVLSVMQTLLADIPGVRLSIDPKTNNLVALATPTQHRTIAATLAEMQRDARQIEVITLYSVDPQLAVLSINKLFGLDAEDADPNGPQIDADPTSNQLLVRATSSQIEQIKLLLDKMGESEEYAASLSGGNVRMLPLTGRSATSALDRLQQIWPAVRQNRIRVVTPSAVIPTMRAGGSEASDSVPTTSAEDLGDLMRMLMVPGGPEVRIPASDFRQEGPMDQLRQDRDNRPVEPAPARPSSLPTNQRPAEGRSAGLSHGAAVIWASFQLPEGAEVSAEPQPVPPHSPSPRRDETEATAVEVAENEDSVPLEATGRPEADRSGVTRALGQAMREALSPTRDTLPSRSATATAGLPEALPTDEAPEAEPIASGATDSVVKELPQIVVSVGPGGIMIASEDTEALDEFEDLLTMLADDMSTAGSDVTVFYLIHRKAAAVAQTIDQILGGGTVSSNSDPSGGGGAMESMGGGILGSLLGMGGGLGGALSPTGSIKITPEPQLNALIVQANPIDVDMIEQLIKLLDQPKSPEEELVTPRHGMIPIYNMQADEVAGIIKEAFKDRMAQSSGGQGGGQRQPSPEDIMRAIRGGGRPGARRDAESVEETQKMTITTDSRSNSLVVVAPDALFKEVESLARQIDEAAVEASFGTMRTVRLEKTSPEVVRQALAAMIGDSAQFGSSSRGRSSSSSRPGSSSGGSSSGQSSADAARRAAFFEMMRARMSGGGRGGGPGGGRPSFGGRGR